MSVSNPSARRWIVPGLAGEVAAVWFIALLVFALAWQAPESITLDVGPPVAGGLTNFEPPESNPQRAYRWSTDHGQLTLPGIGLGPWQITLVAAAGTRPDGPAALTVQANGTPVLQVPQADPDFHTYTFTVPAAAMPLGDLTLDLGIPPFHPPNDPRTLGLAVDQVTLNGTVPRVPAPLAWLTLAGFLATVYAGVRIFRPWRIGVLVSAGVGALLSLLLAEQPLQITPYTGPLFISGLLLLIGLSVTQGVLQRYAPTPPATGVATLPIEQDARPVGGPSKLLPLLLIVGIGYALFSFGTYLTPTLLSEGQPQDFTSYYIAARRLLAHQPLYDLAQVVREPFTVYKYPPFFALLLTPIAHLPIPQALGIWTLINLGFLIVGLWALLRAHGRRLREAAPSTLALLGLVLLFDPLRETLSSGQMEVALFGLVALSYWALRTGRPGWAGLPLAVAVLLKLYPGVLLLYLLLRREWRALASFAGVTLVLVLGSLPFTGIEPWQVFLTGVLPHNGGVTAWIENQTFGGFVARLLTDRIELEPFPSSPAGTAQLLTAVVIVWAVAILGMTAYAVRRGAPPQSMHYALGFAIFTCVSVLVLPAAWYHYVTMMIMPLGIVLFSLEDAGAGWWAAQPPTTARWLAVIGAAAVLLTFGTYWVVWPGANLGGWWKLVLSYKFYGMVLLWLACLWLLHSRLGNDTRVVDT